MAHGNETWTEERVAELRRLAGDRFSARVIAYKLGGVTRNAVIGKAARLGVKFNSQGRLAGCFAKKVPPSRPIVPAEPPPWEPEAPPPGPGVPMRAATSSHCRWIPGEPAGIDTLYCGAPRIEGASYCAHHRWQSISETERRAEMAAA